MTWRITKDHIWNPNHDDYPSRLGYFEEHTRIPALAYMFGGKSQPLPVGPDLVKFRLYDDDGELYYEGELHDDDECLNQEAALKWGESDAGCTTIKVLREGEWKQEIG